MFMLRVRVRREFAFALRAQCRERAQGGGRSATSASGSGSARPNHQPSARGAAPPLHGSRTTRRRLGCGLKPSAVRWGCASAEAAVARLPPCRDRLLKPADEAAVGWARREPRLPPMVPPRRLCRDRPRRTAERRRPHAPATTPRRLCRRPFVAAASRSWNSSWGVATVGWGVGAAGSEKTLGRARAAGEVNRPRGVAIDRHGAAEAVVTARPSA